MTSQRFLRSLWVFLTWAILFSVAYTQSPLYTSNQNTYFLHGTACAEVGYLRQDWLANTRDPTPLFSALVCLTLRWLRFPALFYVYYAILLGIYFSTLYHLAAREIDLQPRARRLVFWALFFLIHSAAFRFVLSRTLGAEWTYALEGGLAGQRVLGSVFQPSSFGVLLLAAINLALQEKIALALFTLAFAAWIHPTYLLASVLLFCAITTWKLAQTFQATPKSDMRQIARSFLRPVLFFVILIAPVVLYNLSFVMGVSPQVREEAHRILFQIRIPHHADPAVWFNASSVFQIFLMLSGLYLARQKGLRWLLGIPLLFGTLLTLIVLLTRNPSLALLFPWRVSVILIPISVTIMLSRLVSLIPSEAEQSNRELLIWILPSIATALITVTLLVGWVRISLDLQRKRSQPERALMAFVANYKQPEDVYLIPVKMQDFRLASGAPIYVDFKSTPYHPPEVLEWHRRHQLAEEFYRSPSCESLEQFGREGINHLVIATAVSLDCPTLEKIYSDNNYQLFRLRSTD
jgi:hypothetical protein